MSSVGTLLRETREKKKVSLEDAARATHIKGEMLAALESDDFEKVPAPTYAKGFLKIYADYLGLDSEEVVRDYLKDHMGGSEQVLILDVEGRVKPRKMRNIIGYALAGAGLLLVLVLLFMAVKAIIGTRRFSSAERQIEILEPSSVTVDEAVPEEPAVPVPAEEMELRLVATSDDVWVKVDADGATVFQNVIKKGGEEYWKSREGFTMRLGRPEAVSLTLDGNPITIPGRKNKPRTIQVDAEGNVEFSK